jgi:hypothetical protein
MPEIRGRKSSLFPCVGTLVWKANNREPDRRHTPLVWPISFEIAFANFMVIGILFP